MNQPHKANQMRIGGTVDDGNWGEVEGKDWVEVVVVVYVLGEEGGGGA